MGTIVANIQISGLYKTYQTRTGHTVALQQVDLAIRQNEFVTLVGPSGCGKSTLLKIIDLLIPPSRGTVLFDGRPLAGPSRDVGIVFQEPVLLPWRGILDNVMLPAEILGLDLAQARRRAMDLLSLVGLAGFEQRYPKELSGGMQQRAAICRSLVHDPSILLMDEPFAALDAMTREELGFELLKIWDVYKKTVVFVTHQISEAILLADRVVAMSPRPGRIEKVIEVSLPRPRRLDMQFSPEFKRYSDEIRTLIRP
jgi:NitT/TauT family transport system ATP-binding protein